MSVCKMVIRCQMYASHDTALVVSLNIYASAATQTMVYYDNSDKA